MLIRSEKKYNKRVMVGIPMTGLVRSEWVIARLGQIIPCNWSVVDALQWLDPCAPLGFMVADARNIIATRAVEEKFEWLFFVDHDIILPPNTTLRWNEYMLKGDIPIWSGLYFTKSVPSEPLVYRGRGNSYYTNWKLGDKVWVDGLPMGCTVIHNSILSVLYEESETYSLGSLHVKKIFETPTKTFYDPQTLSWHNAVGTEDLAFCTRVIESGALAKAGWKEVAKKKYPFLIDTSIFCRHIDWDGVQYPSRGEEQYFIREKRGGKKNALDSSRKEFRRRSVRNS
ncbi:MAG: hypothetical protein QXQ53_01170 [Candidatus Methanosuratincola sp.]